MKKRPIKSKNCYSVYTHVNKNDKSKVYVGITDNIPLSRVQHHFEHNPKFLKDIKESGWDTFEYNIVQKDLIYNDAFKLKLQLMSKYNTVEDGYNYPSSLSLETINDVPIISPLTNSEIRDNKKPVVFCNIPHSFTRSNLTRNGLPTELYVVWFTIARFSNYEGISKFTIGEIFDKCGLKKSKNKSATFENIVLAINFMEQSNYITLSAPVTVKTKYNDMIVAEITDNFFPPKGFVKLTSTVFDVIMSSTSSTSKDLLLAVYLYVYSFISKSTSTLSVAKAFYGSIENMCDCIGICKETATACMNELCSSINGNPPLLLKKKTSMLNVPNIYVENTPDAEKQFLAAEKSLSIKPSLSVEDLKEVESAFDD